MRASCIYRIIKCRRGEGYNPQTIGARLSFTDAGALSKKQNLFLTYLLNGKLYLKNSKGFKLQSFDSISCKKMA